MKQKTDLLYDELATKKGLLAYFSNKKHRVATVFLYERIGKSEKFRGAHPLLRGTIKDFGEYCVISINGAYTFIDVPRAEEYTPCDNKKIGKILEVVKFSDDDYRIRSRMIGEYYSISEKPLMKEIIVCTECTEESKNCKCETPDEEKLEVVKVMEKEEKEYCSYCNKDWDECGDEAHAKITKETPKMKRIEEKWEEPKGVSQEGRDAIRSGNQYKRKMEEYAKGKQGWMDKYGHIIVPVMALAISMIIVLGSIKLTYDNLTDKFDESLEKSGNAVPWWQNPDALNKVGSAVSNQVDQKQNPAPPI